MHLLVKYMTATFDNHPSRAHGSNLKSRGGLIPRRLVVKIGSVFLEFTSDQKARYLS